MVRKSSPIEKVARLLDLVPYISTHQGIALTDLASQFAISEEELLSDLNTLWMCGLPGYTPLELIDLEFESGFVSIRNAETLNISRSLSQQEMISLKLGLDIVRGQLPIDRDDLMSKIDGLQAILEPLINAKVQGESPTTAIEQRLIKEAIAERSNLTFQYDSVSTGALTERTVTPIDTYAQGPYLYLRGFCHTAKAGRTFRLDRMISVVKSESKTLHHSEPPLPQEESSTDRQPQSMVSLRIHGNLRSNREALGTAVVAGESTVKVRALSISWLLRTVIAAGGSMEVLEDLEGSAPGFRAEVQRSAQNALNLYSLNSRQLR
jgi:proteasome accessory factor C